MWAHVNTFTVKSRCLIRTATGFSIRITCVRLSIVYLLRVAIVKTHSTQELARYQSEKHVFVSIKEPRSLRLHIVFIKSETL